jgi:hypothetical protein
LGQYKAFISLRLSILNTLLFSPFRKPLTYGKRFKMLKALIIEGRDTFLDTLSVLLWASFKGKKVHGRSC